MNLKSNQFMKSTNFKGISFLILLLCMVVPSMTAIAQEVEEEVQAVAEEEVKTNIAEVQLDKLLKNYSISIHVGGTMPFTDVRSVDFLGRFDAPSDVQYGVGASIT